MRTCWRGSLRPTSPRQLGGPASTSPRRLCRYTSRSWRSEHSQHRCHRRTPRQRPVHRTRRRRRRGVAVDAGSYPAGVRPRHLEPVRTHRRPSHHGRAQDPRLHPDRQPALADRGPHLPAGADGTGSPRRRHLAARDPQPAESEQPLDRAEASDRLVQPPHPSLTEVTQAHCDSYLQATAHAADESGRRLSPATLTMSVRAPQMLTLYAEILDDRYRPGFSPWAGRSPDVVAGYQRTYGNRVPPVPDTLLRPLLANTLYLVTTIAPLLAAEAGAAPTADQREAASRQHLPAQQLNRLREEIRFRTATGIPAPRLSASNLTRRLARGWDQHDPLLRLAWHPVVVQAIGAMGHRRDLERLRPELEAWVAHCGIEQPWARNATEVFPVFWTPI